MLDNENKVEATATVEENKATTAAPAKEKEVKENKDSKQPNNRRADRRDNKRSASNNRRNAPVDNFEEKIIKIKHISKTTKGGRRMRFSALAVIGDHNGRVGFGIGKATEVPNAIKKAIKNARKNIITVAMNKRHTVFHEAIGRAGASKVLLKPAPEGTGIIAGGVIRAVVELAGFKDLYTKNLGSNTALNMVFAVIDGLKSQLIPAKVKEARAIESSEAKAATKKEDK